MDASTPGHGLRNQRTRRPTTLATPCSRSGPNDGLLLPVNGTMTALSEPHAPDTSSVTRSDVEDLALTIATSSGRAPAAAETRALVAAFRWWFDFLVSQAGKRDADSTTRSLLRDAAEELLFRQGEAAFDRALTPLLSGVLALGGSHADWPALLGLGRAEVTVALENTGCAGTDAPSLGDLLRALRHVCSGRLTPGRP